MALDQGHAGSNAPRIGPSQMRGLRAFSFELLAPSRGELVERRALRITWIRETQLTEAWQRQPWLAP